jgi:hypothetical protein
MQIRAQLGHSSITVTERYLGSLDVDAELALTVDSIQWEVPA